MLTILVIGFLIVVPGSMFALVAFVAILILIERLEEVRRWKKK